MSSAERRALPAKPSKEHLRKQAKRLAAAEKLRLAEAQRRIAAEYGQRDWPALMHAVDAMLRGTAPAPRPDATRSPLSEAAARGDAAAVRRLLAEGAAPDGHAGEIDTPLWLACASDGPAARRIETATLLLDAGARPRRGCTDQTTALHMAARRGPLALVELLIRRGAIWWQQDKDREEPLGHARAGSAADKAGIVALLDRPVIQDPQFRAAVEAIHRGDAAGLARVLDTHPRLLRERAIEPDCYPPSYFRDPKLFWFVANNPILAKRMPRNIVAVAGVMIARGVEKADLDYTLELVMSGSAAREQNLQLPLLSALVEAGATPTPRAIDVALGHRETRPVEALVARGLALTPSIAAALGRNRELAALLPKAAAEERQKALGMAVINRHREAARLCLDAGADVNGFLPVHAHSTPLHQAVANDDTPMLELLLARGAQADIPDTMWNSTALGWAKYMGKREAEAVLLGAPRA
jgi:peptide-methionine (S)-S-oxide reductase